MMTVDPAVELTLRAAITLLLASAAVHKLRDVQRFGATVARYELLPSSSIDPAVWAVIGAELSIAAGLWISGLSLVAARAAAALLLLYAGAIAINLWRGRRDIDCGCTGTAAPQPLSGLLVLRNMGLAGVALLSTAPMAPRAVTWLDGVTIIGGVAVLALAYVAADGLLAHGQRSRRATAPRVQRATTASSDARGTVHA